MPGSEHQGRCDSQVVDVVSVDAQAVVCEAVEVRPTRPREDCWQCSCLDELTDDVGDHRGVGPQSVDLVIGHLEDVDEYRDDRRVVVALCEGNLDALDGARRVGQAEAGFLEDEVGHVGGARRAAHRTVGAVGVAPEGNRAAGTFGHRVHDRDDVREVDF